MEPVSSQSRVTAPRPAYSGSVDHPIHEYDNGKLPAYKGSTDSLASSDSDKLHAINDEVMKKYRNRVDQEKPAEFSFASLGLKSKSRTETATSPVKSAPAPAAVAPSSVAKIV